MTIPTREEIEALAELARKATPGKRAVLDHSPKYVVPDEHKERRLGASIYEDQDRDVYANPILVAYLNDLSGFAHARSWAEARANAEFSAACDPSTILAVIAALTEAEATIARQRECVAQWIIKQGCATGHGDTIEALLTEFEWQLQARIAIADATAARALSSQVETLRKERDEAFVKGAMAMRCIGASAAMLKRRTEILHPNDIGFNMGCAAAADAVTSASLPEREPS